MENNMSLSEWLALKAKKLGHKTTSIGPQFNKLLSGLSQSQIEKELGLVKVGGEWRFNPVKLMSWLLANFRGKNYDVNSIPESWRFSDFQENAEGIYSFREFCNRFASGINTEVIGTYATLGGGANYKPQREGRGIFSKNRHLVIDSRKFIDWLESENRVR